MYPRLPRDGLCALSVHCTLVELYVSVKHAFRGRYYQNANEFVNIYCVLDNVFVQIYLGMNPVQGVCST